MNTLVFEEDGGKMYSGDSAGNVLIFDVFVGEQEPRLGNFLFIVSFWRIKPHLTVKISKYFKSFFKTRVWILGNENFSLFIFRK